jgi:hypothetical protein
MTGLSKLGKDGEILEREVDGWVKPPLCVFCNAPWTDDMIAVEAYAGGGCDTCGYGGEPHGTVTITCSSCTRLVYQKDFDCG